IFFVELSIEQGMLAKLHHLLDIFLQLRFLFLLRMLSKQDTWHACRVSNTECPYGHSAEDLLLIVDEFLDGRKPAHRVHSTANDNVLVRAYTGDSIYGQTLGL